MCLLTSLVSWTLGFQVYERTSIFHLLRLVTPTMRAYAFFFPAALTFAVFFLLLRIITTPKKEPTVAEPKRMIMTGMRIAQTRGGKTDCRGCPSSTNG